MLIKKSLSGTIQGSIPNKRSAIDFLDATGDGVKHWIMQNSKYKHQYFNVGGIQNFILRKIQTSTRLKNSRYL